MSRPDIVTMASLVIRAQLELGLTQRQMGELLGSSLRTVQRWGSRRATPSLDQMKQLAVAVHPQNAPLAAEIADALNEPLETLLPAIQEAPDEPPLDLMPLLVEAVVCAAADALDASPRAVRAALRAAFERAESARLTVGDVAQALRGRDKPRRR
jgi:transcriptional regulator with XRE-family HTH domain